MIDEQKDDKHSVSQHSGNTHVISRFAVSLFFRRTDEFATSKTVKERLTTKIISATNEQEAFGKAYDMCQADFKEFDMVYKLTVPIPDAEIKEMNYKQKRLAKGFTLRQVEEKTGISNAYLSQLENGKIKKPSYDTIQKLNAVYENGL